MPPPETSPPEASAPWAAGRIIAILLTIIPLSQIGLDVYTPALPQMAVEFGASNDLVQNTVTVYILGMAIAFIPLGLISDAVGRKPVVLAGLAVLTVASIGCALANSLGLLLILRFIQGTGAAACLLLAGTIAADCFRGAKLVSVMGLCGAAWGAAPVLAPALGGLLVQVGSWRLVFAVFAVVSGVVVVIVLMALPETLDPAHRSRIHLGAALRVVREALSHRIFVGFALMFGMIGAAQLAFGVVGPFLYQTKLGFSPAAYGLIALVVGGANLLGELTCGAMAQRTSARRLALGAWAVFFTGGVILVVSAELVGVNAWAITVGAVVALMGCGVLDPQSKALAMGVFSRNIGLIAGLLNTCCYLVVSVAMALMAYLPENSQAPLGWLYVGVGIVVVALVSTTMRRPPGETVETVL